MALQTFEASTLNDFDGGRIAKALDAELKRAVEDCRDRPTDERPRKVLLQIEVTPIAGTLGDLETAALAFQIKSTLPARKSRVYSAGVKKNGTLYVNEHAPDNINQGTLPIDE